MFRAEDIDARVREIISERAAADKGILTAPVMISAMTGALRHYSNDFPAKYSAYFSGNDSSFYRLQGVDPVVGKWQPDLSEISDLRHPWDNTTALSLLTDDTGRVDPSEYYTDELALPPDHVLSLTGAGSASGSVSGVFGHAETRIVLAFALADGIAKSTLLDSTGGDYSVFIDATLSLGIKLGGALVAAIAEADWDVVFAGQEMNVLEIVATTGVNQIFLNGIEIATSNTAWTASTPATLYVGSDNALGNRFRGNIDHLRVYSDMEGSTLAEAWEFDGDYAAQVTSPGNDLAANGVGNQFIFINDAQSAETLVFRTLKPETTDTVFVVYTGRHELRNHNYCQQTTIQDSHREAFAVLTAYHAAISFSGRFAQISNATANFDGINYQQKAQTWSDHADELWMRYLLETGQDQWHVARPKLQLQRVLGGRPS